MQQAGVCWITGASSGIGEALAVAYAREGRTLVLSARREAELNRVKSRCLEQGLSDTRVLVLPLDVTDETAMAPAVQKVVDRFGRIDLLINNAGISQRSLAVDTELAVYRKIFDVDVLGQIALTKAVLPVMLAQGEGRIAGTASVAGTIGVPYRTGYCAAKHAVMGFYDALRAELDGTGVEVSTILPGFVRTNISHAAVTGDGGTFGQTDRNIQNGMDPDRCAALILKALHKGRAEIAVGSGAEMHTLWLKRLFPGLVLRMASRFGKMQQ
jgi:short-subunit dehydrogenase